MHYLIIGFGVTGQAILNFLVKQNKSDKLFIIVYDQNPVKLPIYENTNIVAITDIAELETKGLYQKIDLAIASPGVYPKNYRDLLLTKYKIKIISDIQLFANQYLYNQKLRNNNQIYSITGTNGKSTACALLHFLLGEHSNLAGNYGTPAVDLLSFEEVYLDTVLELSSYQLELTDFLPSLAATCLNISPDHLDWHNGYENYINAKLKIYDNSEFDILDINDSMVLELYKSKVLPDKSKNNKRVNIIFYSNDFSNSKVSCSIKDNVESKDLNILGFVTVANSQDNLVIQYNNQDIIDVNQLPDVLKTSHNLNNLLAVLAMLVAKCYEQERSKQDNDNFLIVKYLKKSLQNIRQFKGLPHRCQLVSSFNNIRVYNDSKATNLNATITAIKSLVNLDKLNKNSDSKIVLILGGIVKDDIDRPESRQEFIDCINNYKNKITDIILFTKDELSKNKFEKLISDFNKSTNSLGQNINYLLVPELDSLKDSAYSLAKPGDSILFSPAGASFDQFKNYIERGEKFSAVFNNSPALHQ